MTEGVCWLKCCLYTLGSSGERLVHALIHDGAQCGFINKATLRVSEWKSDRDLQFAECMYVSYSRTYVRNPIAECMENVCTCPLAERIVVATNSLVPNQMPNLKLFPEEG